DPYRGSVWAGMDGPDFRCTKPAAASGKNVAQGFRSGNDGKVSIGSGDGCSGAYPGLKQAIRHHMRVAAQAVGRGAVTRAIEGRVHDDEVEAVVVKSCSHASAAGRLDIGLQHADTARKVGVLRQRNALEGTVDHFGRALHEEDL